MVIPLPCLTGWPGYPPLPSYGGLPSAGFTYPPLWCWWCIWWWCGFLNSGRDSGDGCNLDDACADERFDKNGLCRDVGPFGTPGLGGTPSTPMSSFWSRNGRNLWKSPSLLWICCVTGSEDDGFTWRQRPSSAFYAQTARFFLLRRYGSIDCRI